MAARPSGPRSALDGDPSIGAAWTVNSGAASSAAPALPFHRSPHYCQSSAVFVVAWKIMVFSFCL
jgi:hypothetical protein